jgi:hypothetical protein
MGFLKNFFTNVYTTDAPARPASGFGHLSNDQLEAHLGVARYGDFERDEENKAEVPVIMAAVTRERMMDAFMSLIEQLGETVDVVLETSHGHESSGHTDLYREYIDMPILQSTLWDFEDLLVNDGCTGIAVLNPSLPQEVQLDEHKLLIVYGKDLRRYETIMVDCRVPCREDMRFITEAEHVHSTCEKYVQQFEELKMRLGMDGYR